MAKNLVIVESPAKSRTIGRYLGKDFTVKASMGHIIDLPVKEFGIDIEHDFKPKYVIMKGKSKIVNDLKKSAKHADTIYLAPDPDREGEAIAWHISDVLVKTNPKAKIHRILLNEITKNAIKAAIKEPREIDMHKVNAQQARRILDRIVGYKISPFLWKAVYRGLSAGRVQSVALRIICEREEERDAFKKEEYWSIDVRVAKTDNREFTMKLFKVEGLDPNIKDDKSASSIIDYVKDKEWIISDISKKMKRRNPLPPFITSTIQQEAARKLHFSASKTMSLAQQLYEGLELGESTAGLITYMRTDSTRVSDEARKAAAQYLTSTYGKEYVPATFTEYKISSNAQDAHEAIRPTQIEKAFEPEALKNFLSRDLYRLYDLVWRRFLASQMTQAEYDSTTLDIEIKPYQFRAVGSILRFDGYTKVYNQTDDNGKIALDDKDVMLPEVSKGETVTPREFLPEQHFTQPPPRYSEASLVKELEKQGIGRPSTYAQIIDTLKRRTYVEIDQRRFFPSLLGKTINTLLIREFPDIFNISFTAKMETDLDKVESGEDDWTHLLHEFYEPLARDLKLAQEKTKDLKKALETTTDEKCDKCGKPMVIKWGRNGRFIACSGYPLCRNTHPLEKLAPLENVSINCKLCGTPMIVKQWKRSKFLGCANYPNCRGVQPYPIGVNCPEPGCPGYIAERYSQRGKVFYSCSEYPKCKFASWNKPINKKCEACGAPFMIEHVTKSKGAYLRCLKCKNEVLNEQEEVE